MKTTHQTNMLVKFDHFHKFRGQQRKKKAKPPPTRWAGPYQSEVVAHNPTYTPSYSFISGHLHKKKTTTHIYNDRFGANFVATSMSSIRFHPVFRIQVTAVHCGLDPRNSPMPSHRKRCSGGGQKVASIWGI